MLDRLAALVVDESRWLTASMIVALVGVAGVLWRRRDAPITARRRVLAAMNLFFGLTIGTMAFGHLLAVTTKLLLGTLRGPLPLLYLIGLLLAAPSVALVAHVRSLLADAEPPPRPTVALNAWLGATLLALGLPNLPLALPALLNVGYRLHTRPAAGRVLLGLAIALQAALFAGSLAFLASGRSFEEFRGAG